MTQSLKRGSNCSSEASIQLPYDVFLDTFPDGACLIGPDFRIIQLNSSLAGSHDAKVGQTCYEALAGSSDMCPFCQFYDLAAGVIKSIPSNFHVRFGKTNLVNLKHLPGTGNPGLILETIRPLKSDEILTEEECTRGMLPVFLQKLTGLLIIGRGLMGNLPFEEKMAHVIDTIQNVFDHPKTAAWIELDNHTYGTPVSSGENEALHELIKVGGVVRGKLSLYLPPERPILPEETYFLQEAADLIDRQVEINDLWGMVRHSEERYKRLASNLSKEMWSRTEALVQERAYLEGILRCSEDMIITTDLDSRIVSFNAGGEKMLGYSADDVQGRKIVELWVDAAERDKLMQKVMKTGAINNYVSKLRTKSGEVKEFSLSLSLLKDSEGRIIGTVGISKDIGKEISILRELERLNENYREAIHFINHETKNSLIVMGGFLRRLLQSETDSVRKDQLKIVYHHSKFLEAMSRDFLIMADLEDHGQFQIRKKLIKNFYREVILPAMIGLRERYPDSFQSYDASMGGVGEIQLHGDPALLEVVYRNLFGNALKYRSPNGKIAYGVKIVDLSYVFNVWNEGPGVPIDEKEKIFQKFYRVHNENTKDKRGTGLGLYNIKKIIEAHNGRIWCETSPGNWINFLFELPKNGREQLTTSS